MHKLDIHNKAQLVHYAFQKKIVRIPGMTPDLATVPEGNAVDFDVAVLPD
jgi:hypothetical protein